MRKEHPSTAMMLALLASIGTAMLVGGMASSFVTGQLLVDRLPGSKATVPIVTSAMSAAGMFCLMLAISRIRRWHRSPSLTVSGDLCIALEAVEFNVPIGGPVRVERAENTTAMFNVCYGDAQTSVRDEAGFPFDPRFGASKKWDDALDLARRLSVYLSTPPTSEELSQWLGDYLVRQNAAMDGPDGKTICGFVSFLALVVDNREQGSREAALAYNAMDEHLREAVPRRFLLPLVDAFDVLYREKPTPEVKP